MQSLLPANHRKDTLIVAISPDPMDQIKYVIPIVTERTGREFTVTLLSDADHKLIDRYGLRNESYLKEEGAFVPHPTTYLIDPSGKVRWKFTEKNYAVRPTNEMILAELKKIW